MDKIGEEQENSSRSYKFNTNTSYFSMLNQIANLQIRDFAKASSGGFRPSLGENYGQTISTLARELD